MNRQDILQHKKRLRMAERCLGEAERGMRCFIEWNRDGDQTQVVQIRAMIKALEVMVGVTMRGMDDKHLEAGANRWGKTMQMKESCARFMTMANVDLEMAEWALRCAASFDESGEKDSIEQMREIASSLAGLVKGISTSLTNTGSEQGGAT